MYLYKKTYVQNWEHNPPEQHITEQVAYWRKFNALHGWFIENCGGGVDECQDISVDEEKLTELLGTLKEVSSNFSKAKELLPPTQGFFFGSDEVDEYYKEEVNSTIETIEELLKEHELSKQYGLYSGEFEYRASW